MTMRMVFRLERGISVYQYALRLCRVLSEQNPGSNYSFKYVKGKGMNGQPYKRWTIYRTEKNPFGKDQHVYVGIADFTQGTIQLPSLALFHSRDDSLISRVDLVKILGNEL